MANGGCAYTGERKREGERERSDVDVRKERVLLSSCVVGFVFIAYRRSPGSWIDTTRTDIRSFFSRIKRNPADRSNPMKIERNRSMEYFALCIALSARPSAIDFLRFPRFFSANSLSPIPAILIVISPRVYRHESLLVSNFPPPLPFFSLYRFYRFHSFHRFVNARCYSLRASFLPSRCFIKLSSRVFVDGIR